VDGGHGSAIFTAWIYDHLKPHAAADEGGTSLMLRAIAVAKKRTTASMPKRLPTACAAISCRSATWPRRRFANDGAPCVIGTVGRQAVQMKNKIAVLLMDSRCELQQTEAAQGRYLRELLPPTRTSTKG